MTVFPVEPTLPQAVEAPPADAPETSVADRQARRETLVWLAFGLAGVCYLIAAIREGDPLVIAGAALWLVAVVAYLLPVRR